MSLTKITAAWEKGSDAPRLVLVYGEEGLGVSDAVGTLITGARKSGLQIIRVDGKKIDYPSLRDEIAQVSLFGERRLLHISGIPSSGGVLEDVVEQVEASTDVTLLIQAEGGVDKRFRWYRRLAKEGVVAHYPEPKEHQIPERIGTLAAAAGVKITASAAQAIASRVGTDMLTARNEITKLALYVHPKTNVDVPDVEAVVGRSSETKIWEITEGIGARDAGRSVAALEELLGQGISPGAVLSMVGREIRFLLQARSFLRRQGGNRGIPSSYGAFSSWFRGDFPDEWKEKFGEARGNLFRQHPFVIFQRMRQAPRFKTGELFRLLGELSKADRDGKSGADPRSILFSAVAAAAADGR